MEELEIRLVKSKREYEDVLKIREKVFIEGQNVPKEIERDEYDNISKHVIVSVDNKPIGCARIRNVENKLKLERIAILKEYRSRGFGKDLMRWLVDYSKKQNVKEIYMNAQYYLLDFYKKFGFKPRGEIFKEAGIDHIQMYIKK